MHTHLRLRSGHLVSIDAQDFARVIPFLWRVHEGKAGTERQGRMLYMHRYLVRAVKPLVVKHLNGDTLDNRRSNLLVVTPQQASWMRKGPGGSTSPWIGVSYDSRRDRYRATIEVNGCTEHLGYYQDADEAARAYDAAAWYHRGRLARLNLSSQLQQYHPQRTWSPYMGVTRHQGQWRVRLMSGGVYVLDALYADELAAARAYDAVARQHDRSESTLNFPYMHLLEAGA